MKNEQLIIKILEKSLKDEIENILFIVNQGFDIFIPVEFPEILYVLKKLLEEQIKINPRHFRLLTNPENIDPQNYDDLEFAFIPTILIGNHILKPGLGFVKYSLESPHKIYGQVGSIIALILNNHRFDKYLDCFDSKIFTKLKDIAKFHGAQSLIDAVIQTAYLAGFKGNHTAAYHYLETFNIQQMDDEMMIHNISVESCAKRFLAHCAGRGDDAFDFLKSSLSFYVINKQGLTMSRASQILKVSRTTLLEHLKIAERIGVPTFFEHGLR